MLYLHVTNSLSTLPTFQYDLQGCLLEDLPFHWEHLLAVHSFPTLLMIVL